jgi:hypothetical protein
MCRVKAAHKLFKKKMTNSVPFRIEKELNKVKLIGYGRTQQKAFFKSFFSECKNGGIYQLKPVEVTASELQRNYLFAVYSVISKQTGHGADSIRAYFENVMLELSLDVENDFYSREMWVLDVCDIETGEVKKQNLRTLTTWTVSMMSDFIEMVVFVTSSKFSNVKIPNPKYYTLERVGRKNEVPYPNEVLVYEI